MYVHLTAKLATMTFDPSITTARKFIEDLEDLFNQMDEHNLGLSELQKKTWLMTKIGENFESAVVCDRAKEKNVGY